MNHELLRDCLSIDSHIPATLGRPTQKLPTGKWRYLMQTQFNEKAYGQRWTRYREMALIALTHNIMIVWT